MDPCRQDKNNAEGAGPANQNAGPDDATIVGPHELIRMPRRDAAGRREPNPPRDARADRAPPLVDMTCERLYRQYAMPRSRSASRRASRPWKWIIGAGGGRGLDRRRDHSRLAVGPASWTTTRPASKPWPTPLARCSTRSPRSSPSWPRARRQGRRRRQRRAASRHHRAARSAARRRRRQDFHQVDAIRLAA